MADLPPPPAGYAVETNPSGLPPPPAGYSISDNPPTIAPARNALATAQPDSYIKRVAINLPESLRRFVSNNPGPQTPPPVDPNGPTHTLTNPITGKSIQAVTRPQSDPIQDIADAAHSIARIVTDFPERFAEDPIGTIATPLQILKGASGPPGQVLRGAGKAVVDEAVNPKNWSFMHPLSGILKIVRAAPEGAQTALDASLASSTPTAAPTMSVARELQNMGVTSDSLEGASLPELSKQFGNMATALSKKAHTPFSEADVVTTANQLRKLESSTPAPPSRQLPPASTIIPPAPPAPPDTSGPIPGWKPTILEREPAPPSRQLTESSTIVTPPPEDTSGPIPGWKPTILEHEPTATPEAGPTAEESVGNVRDLFAQGQGFKNYDRTPVEIKPVIDRLARQFVEKSAKQQAAPVASTPIPSTPAPEPVTAPEPVAEPVQTGQTQPAATAALEPEPVTPEPQPMGTLYHGSNKQITKFNPGDAYLAPNQEEAATFGSKIHKIEARAGAVKNVQSSIEDAFENGDDVDDVLKEEGDKARKEGYRYLSFSHPSAGSEGEFKATISLYPHEDLAVQSFANNPNKPSMLSQIRKLAEDAAMKTPTPEPEPAPVVPEKAAPAAQAFKDALVEDKTVPESGKADFARRSMDAGDYAENARDERAESLAKWFHGANPPIPSKDLLLPGLEDPAHPLWKEAAKGATKAEGKTVNPPSNVRQINKTILKLQRLERQAELQKAWDPKRGHSPSIPSSEAAKSGTLGQ